MDRLIEDNFSYKESKGNKVFISWHGKQIKILKGYAGKKFLAKAKKVEGAELQLLLAKITGNFKRGNE